MRCSLVDKTRSPWIFLVSSLMLLMLEQSCCVADAGSCCGVALTKMAISLRGPSFLYITILFLENGVEDGGMILQSSSNGIEHFLKQGAQSLLSHKLLENDECRWQEPCKRRSPHPLVKKVTDFFFLKKKKTSTFQS